MVLKIAVVVAAIAQVVAAGYLSIGTFENSERILPVLIQPASWAFSIWGLIYVLSFIYAVYQVIPRFDNSMVRKSRVPALLAFTGSIAWLYFAGMEAPLVWLTIPILFAMAFVLKNVVTTPESEDVKQNFFSKYTLLPYAAWAGVASWINIQALLIEESIVTTSGVNTATNLLLFAGIVGFTWMYFKKSQYNIWYGGVLVWASVAVAIVNYQRESWLFVVLAAVYAGIVVGQYVRHRM
jgi:benzodiazapine receptor